LLVLAPGQIVLEGGHLGHQSLGLGLVLGGLGLADLLGGRIAPRLLLLQARDHRPPLVVQGDQVAREEDVAARLDAALLKPSVERLWIVPDPLDVEHRGRPSLASTLMRRRIERRSDRGNVGCTRAMIAPVQGRWRSLASTPGYACLCVASRAARARSTRSTARMAPS